MFLRCVLSTVHKELQIFYLQQFDIFIACIPAVMGGGVLTRGTFLEVFFKHLQQVQLSISSQC